MWTYLAILFSAALLIGVFLRRLFYHVKGVDPSKTVEEKPKTMDEIHDDEEEVEKKKRVSGEDRETVVTLCEKAEGQLKAGNEDEAIKCFVQALALDAVHVEAQHKLAMLYMRKQLFSSAAALFKSLGAQTGEAVHYSHLGLAHYQQNQFEEARAAYQKSVDLDPSRPQRFVSLAQVYRSLGQFQNALIALNKALELDSENLDFLLFLAEIQVSLENQEEAEKILKSVLEVAPDSEAAKEMYKSLKKAASEKEDK